MGMDFADDAVPPVWSLRGTSVGSAPGERLRYSNDGYKLLGLILKLGIPAGVSMVVSSISAIVIVGIVNRYGSSATAAYGAVNQVMSYVQFPAMSIGIAASIFAAQAIGARRFEDVEKVTRTALVMNLFVTGALVLMRMWIWKC